MLSIPRTPLSTCPSTQPLAVALANEGAPEGTLVWALEQTAGRGRGDNEWDSAAGKGLWVSFVLRPTVPIGSWPSLTPLVALAMAHAIEDFAEGESGITGARSADQRGGSARGAQSPARVAIKWPNDLFGAFGKLGGVLAEVAQDAVVFGVGVNLSHQRTDFARAIQAEASSLEIEGIRGIHPRELLERFDVHLTAAYETFQSGQTSFLRPGLRARFYLDRAIVEIDAGSGGRTGRAIDVGPDGELVVAMDDDSEERFFGGVVTRFELARPWTL